MRKNVSQCKACGAVIQWVKTERGKFTPINSDGSTHWATCPEAKSFKKRNP